MYAMSFSTSHQTREWIEGKFKRISNAAEASSDESGEGSYDASQSMHRSSRLSPGVVWARDEEEVRTDMEAAATTAVYKKMNRSDPPPLLRFFKSAVSLGTTEKRRPRAAAAAREEKSDYLLAEDDEEEANVELPSGPYEEE